MYTPHVAGKKRYRRKIQRGRDMALRGKKRVAEPPVAALPDTIDEQPPEVQQCVMAVAASSADMAHLPSAAVGHAISMPQCSDASAIAEEVFDKCDKVAAPRWTAVEKWSNSSWPSPCQF